MPSTRESAPGGLRSARLGLLALITRSLLVIRGIRPRGTFFVISRSPFASRSSNWFCFPSSFSGSLFFSYLVPFCWVDSDTSSSFWSIIEPKSRILFERLAMRCRGDSES